MALLKAKTEQAHKETEAFSYGDLIMSGRLQLSHYKDIIVKNYQLHLAVEPALAELPELDELFEGQLSKRFKCESLLNDLNKIDPNTSKLSSVELPFRLQTVPQALGAMYVLEGSSLGGAVIKRALEKIPAIAEKNAFNFYGFYGSELGNMWKLFSEKVEGFIRNEEDQNQIVQYAILTFSFTKNIFSQPLEIAQL